MKKKGINFIVPLVIFPFDIMVSVGQTNFDFEKALKGHMPPNCWKEVEEDPTLLHPGPTVNGRTINFDTGHHTVIRIKEWPSSTRDQGIIAHEIFHAVCFILWRMGISLDIGKTDEVYAYLIDHVTTEVYKKIFK